MGESKLSPFVYWAQTESHISIKIDLRNVKTPEIHLTNEELEFSAIGYGARGQNEYHFVIEFYLPVNEKESHFRVSERQIDFQIKKAEPEFWPRITHDQKKPVWLKIDFDKWKPDEDDEEFETNDEKDFLKNHMNLYDSLKKENFPISPELIKDFKKLYLFLYNLFQFIGFSYVLSVMIINYAIDGEESMKRAYENIGRTMKFLHLLQLLEIIHPLTGYTKGKPLLPGLQVLGRLLIIFVMIDAEPRMQTKPIVFYLFFVYSLAEIVRYPYYMMRVYKKSFGLLTWLRYTVWIPAYPFGFLCEGIIILRNIPFFEETHKYSIALPNAWNFSFDFPTVLRIYLLCLCFPLLYCMMNHMYRQRVRYIGPKSRPKQN